MSILPSIYFSRQAFSIVSVSGQNFGDHDSINCAYSETYPNEYRGFSNCSFVNQNLCICEFIPAFPVDLKLVLVKSTLFQKSFDINVGFACEIKSLFPKTIGLSSKESITIWVDDDGSSSPVLIQVGKFTLPCNRRNQTTIVCSYRFPRPGNFSVTLVSPLCVSSNTFQVQVVADEASTILAVPLVVTSVGTPLISANIAKIYSVRPSIFSDVGGQIITVLGKDFWFNSTDILIGKLRVVTVRMSSAALEFVSPILAVGNHTLSLAGVHTSEARVHVMPFFNSIDFSPKHIRNDEYQMISIAFSSAWISIASSESDISCQVCGIPAIAVMFEHELKCIVPFDARSSCIVSVNVVGIQLQASSKLEVRSNSPILLTVFSSSCSKDNTVSATLVGRNFDPETVFRVFSTQMTTLLSISQLVDRQTAVIHLMKIDKRLFPLLILIYRSSILHSRSVAVWMLLCF